MVILVLAAFPGELEKLPLFRKAENLFAEKRYRLLQAVDGDGVIRFGITGEGRGNVAKFFELYFSRAGRHESPDFVISTGFSGAVSEQLRTGDITVAGEVRDLKTGKSYRCDVPDFTRKIYPPLSCASVDTLAASEAKRALLKSAPGTDFVDMESAAVAEVCSLRRIPWLVIRAVSDSAAFEFPPKEFIRDSWKSVPLKVWASAFIARPRVFFRAAAFQRGLSRAKKSIARAVETVLKGLGSAG